MVVALLSVAVAVQRQVKEQAWRAWPDCPTHPRGLHAEEVENRAVWFCRAAGGHVVAPIGGLEPAS